jgi:hypothetical protein
MILEAKLMTAPLEEPHAQVFVKDNRQQVFAMEQVVVTRIISI